MCSQDELDFNKKAYLTEQEGQQWLFQRRFFQLIIAIGFYVYIGIIYYFIATYFSIINQNPFVLIEIIIYFLGLVLYLFSPFVLLTIGYLFYQAQKGLFLPYKKQKLIFTTNYQYLGIGFLLIGLISLLFIDYQFAFQLPDVFNIKNDYFFQILPFTCTPAFFLTYQAVILYFLSVYIFDMGFIIVRAYFRNKNIKNLNYGISSILILTFYLSLLFPLIVIFWFNIKNVSWIIYFIPFMVIFSIVLTRKLYYRIYIKTIVEFMVDGIIIAFAFLFLFFVFIMFSIFFPPCATA